MDIPIFNLSTLKKYFYNFIATSIMITAISIGVYFWISTRNIRLPFESINSMYVIGSIFVGTYIFNQLSKKELNRIIETVDYQEKFRKYEHRYKKQLIVNVISIVFSGFFLITTQKRLMLYLIICQLVLSLLFYPKKIVIERELKDDKIIYT
ncbi:MAG: hypothetical protein A1D16_09415 [Flavihumibacter sp. CACIAM 22H1]|nr:MAG: hypothetical protein A1D16_09415 [Flavihumibacter sp. CACIAM 22H1]